MSHTNGRWHYFEEEDSYFALIDGWLFQCIPWNNGNLRPEFWRVHMPSLKRRELRKMSSVAQRLQHLP